MTEEETRLPLRREAPSTLGSPTHHRACRHPCLHGGIGSWRKPGELSRPPVMNGVNGPGGRSTGGESSLARFLGGVEATCGTQGCSRGSRCISKKALVRLRIRSVNGLPSVVAWEDPDSTGWRNDSQGAQGRPRRAGRWASKWLCRCVGRAQTRIRLGVVGSFRGCPQILDEAVPVAVRAP
jgi:hypothetical protein